MFRVGDLYLELIYVSSFEYPVLVYVRCLCYIPLLSYLLSPLIHSIRVGSYIYLYSGGVWSLIGRDWMDI